MGEWSFLSKFFEEIESHSPMLGRFWLFLMLVFRIMILGTVATDLFEDEQEEFACNTLQPGCKQVCYDMAFPISLYRFWVFHIVVISTPALMFLMYAMHNHNKRKSSHTSRQHYRKERNMKRLYLVNVAFRMVAEVGVLVGQWRLYGFKVEAQFPCSRFPCPYTVDCFTSRPAEKTIFLCFYFIVGVVSAISSFAELCYASLKWLCPSREPLPREGPCACQDLHGFEQEEAEEDDEKPRERTVSESGFSSVRMKGGSVRSSARKKTYSVAPKHKRCKHPSSRTQMV
ncbi:gap junction delta-3 protein-like [Diretmus argenteus]